MTFNRIPESRKDRYQYTVSISFHENSAVKTLYFEETEIKQWKKIETAPGDFTLVYITGEKEERSVFSNYRIISRSTKGDIETATKYTYKNDHLTSLITVQDGEEVESRHYYYDTRGRIRRIEFYQGDNFFYSTFTFDSSGITQEWHGTDSDGTNFLFQDNELYVEEKWKDNEEILLKEYFTDYSRETDYTANVIIEKYYDDEDRIVAENIDNNGTMTTIEYEYDQYLDKKTVKTVLLLEVYEYTYDSEGNMITEEYFKNKKHISTIHYSDVEGTFREELYRNNRIFMRVFYEDGIAVDDEFVSSSQTRDDLQ